MIKERTNIEIDIVVEDMNRRAIESTSFNAVLDANSQSHHSNLYRNFQSIWTLKKYMPFRKNEIVLEFGSGTGRIIFQISKYFKKIIGVDISDKMIEVAKKIALEKKSQNVKFIKSIGEIDVETNSIDKIYVYWVFSLMPDQAIINALKEFQRILKPDGSLYVFDHTSNSGKEFGSLQIHRKHEHLKDVLTSSNLTIVKNKKVIKHPSRGMSIWNQINRSNLTWLLPILQSLDDLFVKRKPELANYYTEFFELKNIGNTNNKPI